MPQREIAAGEAVRFTFDGVEVIARAGESIAAALAASGTLALRRTRTGAPRGIHCGMGSCFDCIVTVNGEPGVRACLAKAAFGLRVESAMPAATALSERSGFAPTSSSRRSVDVLVIGAGPAGATAAAMLAETGASVIVCDERGTGGGQYYKPQALTGHAQPVDRQFLEGIALSSRLANSGAELWTSATVWFASQKEGVGLIHQDIATVLQPRIILLATGASERPCPLSGWTLPGVMTTGGLQGLVRTQQVVPGQRIVVAGSGPLNLQTGVELLKRGTPPVAIIDSGEGPSLGSIPSFMRMLTSDASATVLGLSYLWALRKARVPLLWRSTLMAVHGAERVEAVRVSGPSGERDIACDVVALNMGFQPQAELARQLGCNLRYVGDGAGSLTVETGRDGRTSIGHVFAIGDGAAIGGAKVAMARARLAAGAIAADLGLAAPPGVTGAAANLERAEAFQRALWSVFRQPPFSPGSIADTTIVCRCEEVSAGAIRNACRDATPTLATVKRLTRAGMGRCQGRFCAGPLTRLVEAAGGPAPDVAGFFAPRPPARPVRLGAIAREKPEWGGHRQSMPLLVSPRVAMPRPPFGPLQADVVVIGAGVVGSTVAWELARSGASVVVVDRHEPNVQASGANAGSLHVQLLSFDFGAKAQAGGRPAAEVLRIAPASIALWKELQAASGDDYEISTPGGLMVGETAAEMAFLRQKVALEQSYGIDSAMVGPNELSTLEPHLARHFAGAALCRDEGKINPLLATLSIVRLARAAGARFEAFAGVTGLSRQGDGWKVTTEAGDIRARRVVNCAGGWAARIAAMAARPIPVQGAPLQMIVTEPGPAFVKHLVAHGGRHLSLKQADTGGLIIGGAWPAALDPQTGASHVEMASIEGNAWVASHVLPAAAHLNIVRVWAAMNINIDGAPILGEMPGSPGFWNCVTSNGYSLAPVVARITAHLMLRGRSDHPHAMFTLDRF